MPYIDDAYLQDLKKQLASSDSLNEQEPEEAHDAFLRIEQLATGREQVSKRMRERLIREGFSEQATEQALCRAINCGLIDDMRYGAALVRTRVNAGKGVRGIYIELEMLDIHCAPAELCPDHTFDDEEELQRALTSLERKPPTSKNKREGAYRRLIAKGYESSIASRASRLWCEKHDVF